jgi:uncharacterized protein involved in exopolysaccharide biosynthesis
LLQIPNIEREYRDLTRDYDNAQTRYREIKAKQMQAEVAQELEKGRKAERFSLGEPPHARGPISPKRMQIVLIGFVPRWAGLGLPGCGMHSIRRSGRWNWPTLRESRF